MSKRMELREYVTVSEQAKHWGVAPATLHFTLVEKGVGLVGDGEGNGRAKLSVLELEEKKIFSALVERKARNTAINTANVARGREVLAGRKVSATIKHEVAAQVQAGFHALLQELDRRLPAAPPAP